MTQHDQQAEGGDQALAFDAARPSCGTCGEFSNPSARFCASCGARLGRSFDAPVRGLSANELRPLTIMFCDLADSSAIAASMDPEDFTEIIGGFFRGVSFAVGRRGGYVGRMLGDGALVYFGFPAAREDDAERAIGAALDILAAFAARPVAGHFLQVRIGLSTGLVVLGDVMGTGKPGSLDVYGETPNLAARLQAMAEPNTILVSESVRRLVGERFEFRDLGVRGMKGWSEPLPILQVVRQIENLSRFEARSGSLANPLLGREEVAHRLNTTWQRASAGRGSVVLLRGEAGIGKSRLIAELVREATGAQVTRLFCAPYQQTMTLQPAIQVLEIRAGIAREDDSATRLSKLRTLLPGADPVDLTLIGELLQIDLAGLPAVPPLTPARKRARLIRAMLDNIRRGTRRGPMLVVVEDAHWADSSTLELISAAVTEIATWRALLIVTARPDLKPAWEEHETVHVIDLPALSSDDGARLVRMVARDTPIPQQIVQDIAARAEGVPLYLEELTRSVIDSLTRSRALRPDQASGMTLRASVPVSISASLLPRLDRLGPARAVAEVASVIGREFELELLQPALADRDVNLNDSLERLVEAGILQPSGAGAYRFHHALLQDATYGMITRDRRRALHGRIAGIMEDLLPETTVGRPQLLAHHWSEAGEPRRAAQWWLHGARQTLAKLAPAEALAQTERGLAQLEGLADEKWRWQIELDLQLVAGSALMVTHGHAAPLTGAAFARAAKLSERLTSAKQRLEAQFGLWSHLMLRGELPRALELAEDMLSADNRGDDPRWRLAGLRARGTVTFLLGLFDDSIDSLQRFVSLWDGGQAAEGIGFAHDPGAITVHCYRSYSLTFAGRITEARRHVAAAMQGARALGHHLIVAQAMFTEAVLEDSIGATQAARPLLERTLDYSLEHGVVLFKMFASTHLATIEGRSGDTDGALRRIGEDIEFARKSGTYAFMPGFLAREAELLALAGRMPEALARFAEVFALAGQTSSLWDEAKNRRLFAKTLLIDGRPKEAEVELRRAVSIARQQGARLFELDAALELAPMLAHNGRQAEAGDMLHRCMAYFVQEDILPSTVRARNVLRHLNLGWA